MDTGEAASVAAAAAVAAGVPKEAKDSSSFSVGAMVRVRWQEVARRATVACYTGSTVEVIFDDDESEAAVDASSVSALEAFEGTAAACCGDVGSLASEAKRCREEGNTLYKLLDRAAAAERYTAAIHELGRVATCSEGAACQALAACDKTLWLGCGRGPGSAGTVRLEFLRPVGGQSFAKGQAGAARLKRPTPMEARQNSLLAVHQADLGDLQVALYLNRARCWLALGSPARTVQDVELAMALRRAAAEPSLSRSEASGGSSALTGPLLPFALFPIVVTLLLSLRRGWQLQQCAVALLVVVALAGLWLQSRSFQTPPRRTAEPTDARLCTALFLRGKARVAQGRLKAAETDAAVADSAADGEGQRKELLRLRREILEARRGNKRLAKEVSKWCDSAMSKASPEAFALAGAVEAE